MWLASAALSAEVEVPVGEDLQQDGQGARADRLPILLAFSAIGCSYCDDLEEEFLEPMLLSGDYADKIIIRKLIIDNGSHVRDFLGRSLEAAELAHAFRVFVTPTILFVDADGRELAERMVGINTLEMFGGYLDGCIDTALLKLRDPQRLSARSPCRLAQN
ncbi:MAG: thioredoxin fold domain-containing protein [Gammaproteobacteria bacterium]|nr:thioredoxin fold domain-containing protein [Gammaproteobacteria bacterium]MDH3559735.1 thioredoxin fold domain-containing protein [Gammaproteobacteria bacterium]